MNTIHPETHFYKNMVRVMPSVQSLLNDSSTLYMDVLLKTEVY